MKRLIKITGLILTLFLSSEFLSAQKESVIIDGDTVNIYDTTSACFHISVKQRLLLNDTTLSYSQLLSYNYFVQFEAPFNPLKLDKLAKRMYHCNEKENYSKAIEIGWEIRKQSPNNITALKEMSLAFKRLNQIDSMQIYFTLMVKTIQAVQLSGYGGVQAPYVLNNSFELISIIEATYGVYPHQGRTYMDSDGQIKAYRQTGCFGYYAVLNQLKPFIHSRKLRMVE